MSIEASYAVERAKVRAKGGMLWLRPFGGGLVIAWPYCVEYWVPI